MPPPCLTCPGNLIVEVFYTPLPRAIEGAEVTITGPTTQTKKTDADGLARFMGIPPGSYDVTAEYNTGNPVADAAEAQIGSTAWAKDVAKDPFPAGANKCNLFVFHMTNAGGHTVPASSRWSWRNFENVPRYPLAGEWAGDEEIPNWTHVTDPEPGDVAATNRNLGVMSNIAGFTGHTGIVTYPVQVNPPLKASIAPEQTKKVRVNMQRMTTSATDVNVVKNEWPRDWAGASYRRYGG